MGMSQVTGFDDEQYKRYAKKDKTLMKNKIITEEFIDDLQEKRNRMIKEKRL